MPDCHAGAGCVIGTTMTITDKICPNLVGVDIGCGVRAIQLCQHEIDFKKLDTVIRENIPYGFAIHETPPSEKYKSLETRRYMTPLCFKDNVDKEREVFSRTIGSLGGGNHFIEVDRDRYNNLWLLIHSGSRNPGLRVAQFYQKLAQEKDPDAPKDLACLSGEDAQNYLHDMRTMQTFAYLNRLAIGTIILENMDLCTLEKIDTAHNYIGADNILRKGAVSARLNEKLLLPLNMRDGALICRGRGDADWNYSAPHGAGRIMSRAEAKKSLKLKEFRQRMEGIYSTCISNNTIDESPMAYKDSREIIDNATDTIFFSYETLRPLYNFKAQ
jgi:RNA-splicing ligase RtcB